MIYAYRDTDYSFVLVEADNAEIAEELLRLEDIDIDDGDFIEMGEMLRVNCRAGSVKDINNVD